MQGNTSSGFEGSREWRSEDFDTWIVLQNCATSRHRRVITWKHSKATEKGSTAFASTISGVSALYGVMEMPTTSRS
jgi:hypothetical protein